MHNINASQDNRELERCKTSNYNSVFAETGSSLQVHVDPLGRMNRTVTYDLVPLYVTVLILMQLSRKYFF